MRLCSKDQLEDGLCCDWADSPSCQGRVHTAAILSSEELSNLPSASSADVSIVLTINSVRNCGISSPKAALADVIFQNDNGERLPLFHIDDPNWSGGNFPASNAADWSSKTTWMSSGSSSDSNCPIFQLRMFLAERPTRYVFLTSDQSTDYDPTEWEFEICEGDETSCVTFGYAQEPPTERQVQYVPEYVPPRVPSTTPTELPTEPTTIPPIDPDFPGTPNPAYIPPLGCQ